MKYYLKIIFIYFIQKYENYIIHTYRGLKSKIMVTLNADVAALIRSIVEIDADRLYESRKLLKFTFFKKWMFTTALACTIRTEPEKILFI